ncbi:unnamed protein product [Peniophora sp. CBMAI 1063]|nr:unnamed protein product [Peniophora sp. CBMAI 1063]
MFIPLTAIPSATVPAAITSSSAATTDPIATITIAATTNSLFARAPTEPQPLSAGSIVGIVIGAVLLLTLIVTLSIFAHRHLVRLRALKAEQRRRAEEAAARQAAIDEEIRKQRVREEVFRNAKIIQADAARRREEGKWDRLKARKERERRMREIEERVERVKREREGGVVVPEAAQVAGDAMKEREVYRPVVTQSNPYSHGSA